MDYSKLTKDALIEILEAKNLSYSSSQSKDDLISLHHPRQ